MPSLPSKFLRIGASPMTLNRASDFLLLRTSSLRTIGVVSLRPGIIPASASSDAASASASSRRFYATPASSSAAPLVVDSVNLLDKATDLNLAFALPPPPTPVVPPDASSATDAAVSSLADLGLGGIWPPGLVQHGLDYLHSLGLPWWGCIVVGACVVRTCMIPLFAAVQRNSTNLMNHAPEMQQLQMEMLAAHQAGDRLTAQRLLKEQSAFMTRNDISHFRQLRLLVVQGTVFCSMFYGLRQMAEAPVAGFSTEGLLHIVDLTTRDPFFVLPCITTATLLFIMRVGAEGMSLNDMPIMMQRFFTILPFLTFPPVAYFPAALGLYWVTSNFFSMIQFFVFRSDAGKKLFMIPEKRVMPEGFANPMMDKAGFAEQFAKMVKVAEDTAKTQQRIQSMQLPDDRHRWAAEKAGVQPPKLTPEEMAERHSDIKKIIKEINEMKTKVDALNPDKHPETTATTTTATATTNSTTATTRKPPDIHITIPTKDKTE